VARVAGVEVELAADVGQAKAVAVERDAADHAGQDPAGVRRRRGPEPDRVHYGHRPRGHGPGVGDGAADPRGRALVRLHVRRVIVRLDFERDRVALADVDHPGVVADPGEQGGGSRGLVRELPQVPLGGLVRAVLAPHDRVQRELGSGWPAVQRGHDRAVLVLGEPELGEWLRQGRRARGLGDRVGGDARTPAGRKLSTEVKKPNPSADGPVSAETACSGCGIRPTTLPAALQTPAMSAAEPFGLPLAYLITTWPPASRPASVAGSAAYAPSPLFSGTTICWPGW